MKSLAGIRIKITIKQEIYKYTHTHKNNNVQNNSFLLVAASVLAFFIKKVTIDERKSKKHLKNKSMTKNIMKKIIQKNFDQSNNNGVSF